MAGLAAATPPRQAFLLLRTVFTVAPILFELDKFANVLTDWPGHLAPRIDDLVPGTAQQAMYAVGVVEILAGIAVAVVPQVLHHERDDWAVWYGFGREFVIGENGTVRNTYKDGANAGASGVVRYYPADELDVVVLSNSADGAWPPIDEIHRLIRADNPSIGESGVGFR